MSKGNALANVIKSMPKNKNSFKDRSPKAVPNLPRFSNNDIFAKKEVQVNEQAETTLATPHAVDNHLQFPIEEGELASFRAPNMSPTKNIPTGDLDVFLVDGSRREATEQSPNAAAVLNSQRVRALDNHSMWQKDWDRTAQYIHSRREETGIPLLQLQDTYKDQPLPESAMETYEINATLASGLKSDQITDNFYLESTMQSGFASTFDRSMDPQQDQLASSMLIQHNRRGKREDL